MKMKGQLATTPTENGTQIEMRRIGHDDEEKKRMHHPLNTQAAVWHKSEDPKADLAVTFLLNSKAQNSVTSKRASPDSSRRHYLY